MATSRLVLMPLHIEMATAKTLARTPVAPFMPHIQGRHWLEYSRNRRRPRGKHMPMGRAGRLTRTITIRQRTNKPWEIVAVINGPAIA